jgi:spermidine/putrescine transport system substrate-binding protein
MKTMKLFTTRGWAGLLSAAALLVLAFSAVNAQTPELRVLNWQGYGSDEPWAVEQFEEKFGVRVVHDYFTSLDEMLTKLRTSPGVYDAVQMNIAYLQPAVEENLIQPIDVSLIPAWESFPENFRELPELSQGTEDIYAIPWAWGATSLVYNTEVFPDGVTSLAALWDEQYAGQIGMIDSYEEAVIFAGLYTGVEDALRPTEEELEAVRASLEELVPGVRTYWQSEDEFNRLFESGEISLGIYWSGSAARAQNAFDLPMAFVVPEEGGIGWIDTWTVAADAPNAELAIEWINFMSDPEFYAEWDRVAGAPVPANTETLELLPDDSMNKQMFSDPEVVARLVFQTYIPDEVRQELQLLWQEVKLFGGQ